MNRSRAALVLLLVLLALAAGGRAALADGDPASDVLVAQSVFLPYPPPSAGAGAALQQEVAAVTKRGDRIKVAVIATPTDLGSVPSLFGKPSAYAAFLGQELGLSYAATLLVVMPAGFGVYDHGASTSADDAALKSVAIPGASPDQLASAARTAVGVLSSAGLLHYKDRLAPSVYAFAQTVQPGAVAKLRYAVSDDSGRASLVLRVRESGRVLTMVRLPTRALNVNALYTLDWRVPRALAGKILQFCAQATDPSGNASAASCAAITVA